MSRVLIQKTKKGPALKQRKACEKIRTLEVHHSGPDCLCQPLSALVSAVQLIFKAFNPVLKFAAGTRAVLLVL